MTQLTYEQLTGEQKTAIFLLALGEEGIKSLFEKMSDVEVRRISMTMARLGHVNAALVKRVLQDFVQQTEAPTLSFDPMKTEQMLQRTLPVDRSETILDRIKDTMGCDTWDKLGALNPRVVADYLKKEYPQTVAVVLAHMPASAGAKVLDLLPESFALDVMLRLLRLDDVQKDALSDIEKTLKTDLLDKAEAPQLLRPADKLADIFNQWDGETAAQMMQALLERQKEAAEQVLSRLFQFTDFAQMDPQSVRCVLQSATENTVVLALYSAPEVVRKALLQPMSAGVQKRVLAAVQALQDVKENAVVQAQAELVALAKQLAQEGHISLPLRSQDNTGKEIS